MWIVRDAGAGRVEEDRNSAQRVCAFELQREEVVFRFFFVDLIGSSDGDVAGTCCVV